MSRYRFERMCGGEAVGAVPKEVMDYDLEAVKGLLRAAGWDVGEEDFMVEASRDGLQVTVYRTGRVMVSPMRDVERGRDVIESVYGTIEPAR